MKFIELAKERYSVRKFDPRPVEQTKIDAILEAANVAPTGVNAQPHRIYVIRSAAALEKIRTLTKCHFGASAVLMFAVDHNEEWKSPLEEGVSAGVEDVSIVATHAMLEAWEQGIGSCWVNLFSRSAAKAAFELPESETPILLMPIGYAAADSEPSPRHFQYKDISETVKYM